MFRCRSRVLLLRQHCRGASDGLGDSGRTIKFAAARTSLSLSACRAAVARTVAHACFQSKKQHLRALSTLTHGARNRSIPITTSRLVRSLYGLPSNASARRGGCDENDLFSSRPGMPGQDELSGEEHLFGNASVRRLASKGRLSRTDLRRRRRSKNRLVHRIKLSNHRGAHDDVFASELDPPKTDAPEYRLWPENPWRSDENNDSAQQDTEENNKSDLQLSHVTTASKRPGYSFYHIARAPAKALSPVSLAQEKGVSRTEKFLFRFFTRLESLVNQKAPGQILQHFNTVFWLDAKIASTFGEEELDILDRALDVVAHDEFAEPMHFTITGVKSTRFQTSKCLAMYQRWGLRRPCNWAAALVKAASGISHSKRMMPRDDLEERLMSDIIIYLKTSSFLGLWRAFLVEYRSPLTDRAVLARSRAGDIIHDSGRKSFQESVFSQLTSWPWGDDPVLDEKINGAFILTIALCSDLVPPTASQHVTAATLNANPSEETTQNQGTSSTSGSGMAHDIYEQDPSKWDLPLVMAGAIAPASLNTTWARLLLAKLSVPGEQARAGLSDIANIRDATRQGMALRPLQDALLAPSTDAVIAWLKTSRVEETRAFGDWLLQGQYRVYWILPAVLRRRLCHALFGAFLRLGLLAEARELLKRDRSHPFGRGACSALLRAFYRDGDVSQFRSFWLQITKPASRERWGVVPRFWQYYRLRFMWKQHPTWAFDFLLSLNEDVSLSKVAYARVRSSLVSMASLDIQQKIGAKVEIADASLVLSPGSTDAIRDLCIIVLRHSIYTGQIANARLWFRLNRKRLGNDDDETEPLDSARRLIFHYGLMAPKDLNWRDIAELFMSAISLRFPSLDGPALKVLMQDRTALAKAEQCQLDSLMTAVTKTNRLFEEAVHRSQRSDKIQVLEAFRRFLASLPRKGFKGRATNARYRLIDALPKPSIKSIALYGSIESEHQIERQDEAKSEPGKSSEERPQPREYAEPQALEREERLQEKETTTTTPHLDREPPTLNLVRKHLGGRVHREGIRARHWLNYRPASAKWASEPEEPGHDTDAGLREAQPEPEEISKGHLQRSEDIKPSALEEDAYHSLRQTSLTMRRQASPQPRLRILKRKVWGANTVRRPRPHRTSMVRSRRTYPSRRPRMRIRKHPVKGRITARRLKSLPTRPVKSRQDPLNPPEPSEDAHIAGSEPAPGPPPPLRIWKHKVWDPSTGNRPKLHNTRRHKKA